MIERSCPLKLMELLMTAAIGALFAVALRAEDRFGDWDFEVKGDPVIRFCGDTLGPVLFVCVEPGWKTQYFWLSKLPYKTERTDKALIITSDPESPTDFYMDDFRFEATGPTSMRMVVNGRLARDAPALIEYVPLSVPAHEIEGGTIHADGEELFIGGKGEPLNITSETRKFVIKKKSGAIITLEVLRGDGLTMSDRRATTHRGKECFLFILRREIAPRGEFCHEIALRISGEAKRGIALPPSAPSEGAVSFRKPLAEPMVPLASQICPVPKEIAWGSVLAPLPKTMDIAAFSGELRERFVKLCSELFETVGVHRAVKGASGESGFITVKTIEAPGGKNDYYEMAVAPSGVTISSPSPQGAYYALSTLVQLVNGSREALRCATVRDWADFPFRGVHLLADDNSLKLHDLLIRRVFGPLKINHIIFECEHVKWPSHPEMHQSWGMTTEDLEKLIAIAKGHFIEVSPLFQTLGHCEYLFKDGANMDLAEDPTRPYAYNVSNPRTYVVIGQLFADMRRVFPSPRYLNIGHDEIAHRGGYPARPENLVKSPAELLLFDMKFYEAYAAKEKIKLMMWHDMLRVGKSDGQDISKVQSFASARSKIDKRTLIGVWDYEAKEAFPDVDIFQMEGFPVVGVTGEEEISNVINFSRYGKKRGIDGMLHTTWTGYGGNALAITKYPGKIWPYVQAGASFWNVDHPAVDYAVPSWATRNFAAVVKGMYARRYLYSGDELFSTADLSSRINATLAETGSVGWRGGFVETIHGGQFEISSGEDGLATVVTVSGGAPLSVTVNKKAKAVSFLWAGLGSEDPLKTVGTLVVETDHGNIMQPLAAGREIGGLVQEQFLSGAGAGRILTRENYGKSVYPVAQPVFPSKGEYTLWQYDFAVDGAMVKSISVEANKNASIAIAGITIVN